MAAVLDELKERYDYAKTAWQPIHDNGAANMRYVSGDPWDDDDKKQRANRPTVAPDELSQYFNQVINPLRMNPRGMRFMPRSNGASEQGARFYQNKARETEYRSKAKIAYLTAAENAVQRGYGYIRFDVRYGSARDANQEIWIAAIPDPDMVLPDPDALSPDLSDQQYCFIQQWMTHGEFKRSPLSKQARVSDFSSIAGTYPKWFQGNKLLTVEYWTIGTRKRQLVLVRKPPVRQPNRAIAPQPVPADQPVVKFADEVKPGEHILRDIREVDYPAVKKYLSNGVEILSEMSWPGKFIPIVGCFGKILYVPDGGTVEKQIKAMTDAMREPWKALCYASSSELEVIGRGMKTSAIVAEGQLGPYLNDWLEAPHNPKAVLFYKALTDATGPQILPPPIFPPFAGAAELQSLEVVKEGFRRQIQSAAGSNFLPTQAQRQNEKSKVALDKIEQSASTGTFHFVDHYDGMILQGGMVFEDLCDKVYDYTGDTGVMEPDGTSQTVRINDPNDPESFTTAGDYGVTVSTGPSSDSEQEAVADFLDTLISNAQVLLPIVGPKILAAVYAKAIRMRNLGPQGDQLADLIEPPEFKTKDGQPPSPELMAAQGQIQHLTQLLQQAQQEKQAKVVEQQGKFAIEQMKTQATSQDKAADREVKLVVAELGAKVDRLALLLEASDKIGVRLDGLHASQQQHTQAVQDRVHEDVQNVKDRAHEHVMAHLEHVRAKELADQAAQHASNAAVQQAALQPQDTGMNAGA